MEVRYMGFDQLQNARAYRFDVIAAKGESKRQYIVTVDLALFRAHHIGIQEGPSLSADKLTADLGKSSGEPHVLTPEDMRAYAEARSAAEAKKAEARKGNRGRSGVPQASSWRSPWRGTQS